jgi:hypothetical protein
MFRKIVIIITVTKVLKRILFASNLKVGKNKVFLVAVERKELFSEVFVVSYHFF